MTAHDAGWRPGMQFYPGEAAEDHFGDCSDPKCECGETLRRVETGLGRNDWEWECPRGCDQGGAA